MDSKTLGIEWIAFDADDTLWENEKVYRQARTRFLEILSHYNLKDGVEDHVHQVEVGNLPYYGYGVMSFILSLIETGVTLTEGEIHGEHVQEMLSLGKEMLSTTPEVFPGVPEMLDHLSSRYPLLLITKGDLFHQQRKVAESGLGEYFRHIEVVAEKKPSVYQRVLRRHQISPGRFLMVGNSLRSDIQPVVALGGWAVHVSDHASWSHEDQALTAGERERVIDVGRVQQVADVLLSSWAGPGKTTGEDR